MKGPVLLLLISLAAAAAQLQWIAESGRFVKEAAQGSWDMARAYNDMKDANYIGADKYFHARGNYDAAQRGRGGEWAAKVISDAREFGQMAGSSGRGREDSLGDQRANEWGRSGNDPNHFRPNGLPSKY